MLSSLAAGNENVCGLAQDNKLYCWGDGVFGVLGGGDPLLNFDQAIPAAVVGLEGVVDYSLGNNHICALTADGKLYCWGDAERLQLGLGLESPAFSPVEVPLSLPAGVAVVDVEVGGNTTCVSLSSKEVRCWGSNFYGSLGRAQSEDMDAAMSPPVVLPEGFAPGTLSMNLRHVCAQSAPDGGDNPGGATAIGSPEGPVVCWGGKPVWPDWNRDEIGD